MTDTGGDWTRRHARLEATGDASEEPSGERDPVVRAEPPADEWRARHAWCQR